MSCPSKPFTIFVTVIGKWKQTEPENTSQAVDVDVAGSIATRRTKVHLITPLEWDRVTEYRRYIDYIRKPVGSLRQSRLTLTKEVDLATLHNVPICEGNDDRDVMYRAFMLGLVCRLDESFDS